MIIQKRLTNWLDFVAEVEPQPGRDQQIFRGMSNPWKDGKATFSSSFDKVCERFTVSRDSPPLNSEQRRLLEAWMLFEFKREAKNHLAEVPAQNNFLEWMALARHYGTPSRLVDFSYSPYVAAYFALAERQRDISGWVLAINLKKVKCETEKMLEAQKWYGVTKESATFHLPKFFHRFAFKHRPLWTAPVNPSQRNPRLAAQQGLFLCPGDVGESFEDNLAKTLETMPDAALLLELTDEMRAPTIRQLSSMNINVATLYKDLTGWAQYQGDLVHHTERLDEERFKRVLEMSTAEDPEIP